MSDLLCVTNRTLCREDFLHRIEAIAACSPAGILLREKDLPEPAYRALAVQVLEICRRYDTRCILHSFVGVARELGASAIHLPLPLLRRMRAADRGSFREIGASCHSPEEAREAQRLGCTYITAGHIFPTDCKQGVPPRGLVFLRRVCESVSIPVYAIGGIDSGNIAAVRESGASGACVMSGAMTCPDVRTYLSAFEKEG